MTLWIPQAKLAAKICPKPVAESCFWINMNISCKQVKNGDICPDEAFRVGHL